EGAEWRTDPPMPACSGQRDILIQALHPLARAVEQIAVVPFALGREFVLDIVLVPRVDERARSRKIEAEETAFTRSAVTPKIGNVATGHDVVYQTPEPAAPYAHRRRSTEAFRSDRHARRATRR